MSWNYSETSSSSSPINLTDGLLQLPSFGCQKSRYRSRDSPPLNLSVNPSSSCLVPTFFHGEHVRSSTRFVDNQCLCEIESNPLDLSVGSLDKEHEYSEHGEMSIVPVSPPSDSYLYTENSLTSTSLMKNAPFESHVLYKDTGTKNNSTEMFCTRTLPISDLSTQAKDPEIAQTHSSPLEVFSESSVFPTSANDFTELSTQPNMTSIPSPYKTLQTELPDLSNKVPISQKKASRHVHVSSVATPLLPCAYPKGPHTHDTTLPPLDKDANGDGSREVQVRLEEDPKVTLLQDKKRCKNQMIGSHVRMEHRDPSTGELNKITNAFSFCNHAGYSNFEIMEMSRNLWRELNQITDDGANSASEWPDIFKVVVSQVPETIFPTPAESESPCNHCDITGLRTLSKLKSVHPTESGKAVKTKKIAQVDGTNDMQLDTSFEDENCIRPVGIFRGSILDEPIEKRREEKKQPEKNENREIKDEKKKKENRFRLKRNALLQPYHGFEASLEDKNKTLKKNNKTLRRKNKAINKKNAILKKMNKLLLREELVKNDKKHYLKRLVEVKTPTIGSLKVNPMNSMIGLKKELVNRKTKLKDIVKEVSFNNPGMKSKFKKKHAKVLGSNNSHATINSLIERQDKTKPLKGMTRIGLKNPVVRPGDRNNYNTNTIRKEKIVLDREIKVILNKLPVVDCLKYSEKVTLVDKINTSEVSIL